MKKISTGIDGLDEVLKGGYPRGLPTLLKGISGSGKTIFCQLFTKKCIEDGHQVSYVTSDELPHRITENMHYLGVDTHTNIESGQLKLLDFTPSLSDTVAGHFELDAILLRIKASFDSKEPVLIIDSLQNLFIGLDTNNHIMFLLTLFNWCRENKITLLTTAGEGFLSGVDGYFEEYASDCVVCIQQQVHKKLMTRYLRVLKYRGTSHGTNEYPFLLTNEGVFIFPITEARLNRKLGKNRLKTGLDKLDDMLGGGYLRPSSMMISGSSGTAKSLLSALIAVQACTQQNKVLYISFEESQADFIHNVNSANVNLMPAIEKKQLLLESVRSVEMGLEEHLINIINLTMNQKPDLLIIDPVSSLLDMGTSLEVKSMLVRFISYLKNNNITIILTELLKEHDEPDNRAIIGVSSLVDTWIKLALFESNGEFNRLMHIIKSRGSATSNQVKEFKITDDGLSIEDPYIGSGGMIFGSEKNEKILIDTQKYALLEDQLKEVNRQIQALDEQKFPLDSTELVRLKQFNFYLLERRRKLELEMKDIQALRALNHHSRDH